MLLVNIIRDVVSPFRSLDRIDTQYALTLTIADGRRFPAPAPAPAPAAPATGRLGAARMWEDERKALRWSGPLDDIPTGAGLRSDAGGRRHPASLGPAHARGSGRPVAPGRPGSVG